MLSESYCEHVSALPQPESGVCDRADAYTYRLDCRSGWCPACLPKYFAPRFQSYLSGWDWQYVRHIVLTVDPRLYMDGYEAWRVVSEKRAIAGLIRDLNRKKNYRLICKIAGSVNHLSSVDDILRCQRRIKMIRSFTGSTVLDYFWVLEWHSDGRPHWHLLLLLDRAVPVTGDVLRSNWSHGLYVIESRIRDAGHWAYLSGYVSKTGYFEEGKAYQTVNPYAGGRYKGKIMRKWGHKHRPAEKECPVCDVSGINPLPDLDDPDDDFFDTLSFDSDGGLSYRSVSAGFSDSPDVSLSDSDVSPVCAAPSFGSLQSRLDACGDRFLLFLQERDSVYRLYYVESAESLSEFYPFIAFSPAAVAYSLLGQIRHDHVRYKCFGTFIRSDGKFIKVKSV